MRPHATWVEGGFILAPPAHRVIHPGTAVCGVHVCAHELGHTQTEKTDAVLENTQTVKPAVCVVIWMAGYHSPGL